MFCLSYKKHVLQFKFDAGTSRGILKEKATWLIRIYDQQQPAQGGFGECGPLTGLSIDDDPKMLEAALDRLSTLENLHHAGQLVDLDLFPSLRFALETAFGDLQNKGRLNVFENAFSNGSSSIPINGLIWMGSKDFMLQQIKEKLEVGFTCLKLKIGALDFDTEKEVLAFIRRRFGKEEVTLRVDANGAFHPRDALQKLRELSDFHIHSIEQPIRQGQWEEMASLCLKSPVPIALDEELIGIHELIGKHEMLEQINPGYVILKPTLLGGFTASDEWIELAEKRGIGWWITSALESNVGLNAICQYTFEKLKGKRDIIPQGLGTGGLYHNNIPSPLQVREGCIFSNPTHAWDLRALAF